MSQSSNRRHSVTSPSNRNSEKRIAFVQSCWHREIVDQARIAFLKEIKKVALVRHVVDCFEVPGAFEIPLQAKLLAKSGQYAAIVAAGLVVDGGIYRHEFVAASVIDALMSMQLESEVPIISVVLTPQRFHEHEDHLQFFRHHFVKKGEEAALACAATIENLGKIAQVSG
jgi:6,7-dimethyl-8-ribityllumazine synthase